MEEEGFRYVEYQAIKQLKDKKALVIATGGGSCTNSSTAKLLKEMGTVIYLKQSLSTVKKRLSSRFPITDQFLEKRLPLYAAAAHITIDVEGLSIDEIVKQILEQYGK